MNDNIDRNGFSWRRRDRCAWTFSFKFLEWLNGNCYIRDHRMCVDPLKKLGGEQNHVGTKLNDPAKWPTETALMEHGSDWVP